MREKKIIIWGTSVKKIADEAQLLAIMTIVKQQIENPYLVIITAYPEEVEALLGEMKIKGKAVRLLHFFSVASSLFGAKWLLIIGGPFYEDTKQMLSHLYLRVLTMLYGVSVIAYGTTFFQTKTKTGRLFYRCLFNSFKMLAPRERDGMQIINALGIHKQTYQAVDIRFSLEPSSRDTVHQILKNEGLDSSKPYLTVTTRYLHDGMPEWVKKAHDYSPENLQSANDALSALFEKLAERFQIVLIPMHPSMQEDLETAKVLSTRIKEKTRFCVLKKRYDPQEVIGLIHFSSFLIAGRLGSTIFATLAKIPFLGIAYESRMFDFMERSGLQDYCFDWKALDSEEILGQIDRLLANREKLENILKQEKLENKEQVILDANQLLKVGDG